LSYGCKLGCNYNLIEDF